MNAAVAVERSPIFDAEELLARVDGDLELLREIVQLFDQQAPAVLAAVEQAAQSQDAEALYSAAHKLKGSVATFAAPEVYEVASSVEMMGRKGQLNGAVRASRNLAEAVEELRIQLTSLVEVVCC